jgi:flagellar basal-body rod modification protein FlgD
MTTAIGSDLNLASFGAPAAGTGTKRNTVDQDTFLQLMVTQLQNQDPFKPLDPSAFLGQLAQFSSVSSLNSMSKSVSDLATSMTANQTLQASSLIGRTVLVDGNTGTLASGQPLTGAVELPYATSSGVVGIYDQSGVLVRQMPLGSRDAGLNRFSWDGLTSTGQTAPPGTYAFKAVIRTADGDTALSTYAATKVTSIALSSDLAASSITTDSGQQVKLAQVKAIQ